MGRVKKKLSHGSFEESLKKLEEIVRRLEEERVPLEESLQLFAEGRKIARECEAELQRAEIKVKQLIEDSEGKLIEIPLDGGEDDEEPDPETPETAPKENVPESAKKPDDLPF